MRKKLSRMFVVVALVLAAVLISGIVALVAGNCCVSFNLAAASATCDYSTCSLIEELLQGTQTRAAEMSLTPTPTATSSSTTPYEPTLYAERQAMLRDFETAAGPATYVQFYATETALVSAYWGMPTNTPTPTSVAFGSCAFQWSNRDLPAITNLAQIALSMYTDGNITVRVEAYGENCLDSKGTIQSFGAMTTDFYVTVTADAMTDDQMTAALVMRIYQAFTDGLEGVPLEAQPGYLDITFKTGNGQKHLRTMFRTIETAEGQGLEGKALLDALGGLQ